MIRSHKYLFIVFFACMLGLFVATPKNVFADTLARCNYIKKDSKGKVSEEITIYVNSDYSMTGTINTYQGKPYKDGIGFFINYNYKGLGNAGNLQKTAKKRSGSSVCPTYVAIRETTTTYSNTATTNIELELRGYYRKSTMNLACKNFKTSFGERLLSSLGGQAIIKGCSGALEFTKCFDGKDATKECGASESKFNEDRQTNKCTDILGDPTDTGSVANLLQVIFNYIKILGPLLVIILSSLDFTKVILTGDEKSMKKAQSNLGIRIACAVLLFFIPTIVILLFNLILNGNWNASNLCNIK